MLVENTLLKTACRFLLLLAGFDTITYRKDYDRSRLLIELALVFSLEEERVMQQSRVSISLSFENQGINPVGGNTQVTEYLHKQTTTCTQRNKGLLVPSRLLAKVISNRDR